MSISQFIDDYTIVLLQGLHGERGFNGAPGLRGVAGSDGAPGEIGPRGTTGNKVLQLPIHYHCARYEYLCT